MYKKRFPIFDSYDTFVDYNLNQYRLNESYHVFMNCRDAIDSISKEIYKQLKSRDYNDFKSDYAYCPELKKTVSSNEPEYRDSFPIYVKFEYSAGDWDMAILDRKDYPDKVMLMVNINIVHRTNKENLYDYVHSKVTHEMGHIRQNYGYRKKDISQTRKFMSSDIDEDIFEFPGKYLKNEAMIVVKNYMYTFSPTEMHQRCSELYDAVMSEPVSEFESITKMYKNRNDSVTRIIDMFDDVHLSSEMNKLINQAENALNNDDYLIVLIIAYYFKQANLYKRDAGLNRKYIQGFLDTGQAFTPIDRKYVYNFIMWLKDHYRHYIHDVYTVVHFILYNHIWHFIKENLDVRNIEKMREFLE